MENPIVYTGTFTGGRSFGIYAWEMDGETGELTLLSPPVRVENPSYLAWGRADRLYCVCENTVFHGVYGGGTAAFAVGPGKGELRPLNSQPTLGSGPCCLCVDPTGRFLLTAQYGDGTLSVFPLEEDGAAAPCSCLIRHSGATGPVADRQERPHAHCVRFTPDGGLALAADLGLDRIKAYRLDGRAAALQPAPEQDIALRPGSGPRHFLFADGGRFLYVVCEVSSEIAVFRRAGESYEPVQYIASGPAPMPAGNTAAALRLSPDARFLYASNRGQDSLAVFARSPADGKLTLRGCAPCGGAGPRDFNLDPSGRFLLCANQSSQNIVTFSVDAETGALTPTGRTVTEGSPVCVLFAR